MLTELTLSDEKAMISTMDKDSPEKIQSQWQGPIRFQQGGRGFRSQWATDSEERRTQANR